jgi:hypothetical protein
MLTLISSLAILKLVDKGVFILPKLKNRDYYSHVDSSLEASEKILCHLRMLLVML